jgi:hypothetical protein
VGRRLCSTKRSDETNVQRSFAGLSVLRLRMHVLLKEQARVYCDEWVHNESAPSCYRHSMRARRAPTQPGTPSTENRMLHSPCCVDGHYGSRMFSVVRCPLYEMAMGSGGTMTGSPSRHRDGGSQRSRCTHPHSYHTYVRFASSVFHFLHLIHARALCYLVPSFDRLSVLCIVMLC